LANVEAVDYGGETPLTKATNDSLATGELEVVRYLVEHGKANAGPGLAAWRATKRDFYYPGVVPYLKAADKRHRRRERVARLLHRDAKCFYMLNTIILHATC